MFFFLKDNFTSHSSPVIAVTISWQASTCCLSCSFFNGILSSKVRIRANSCISNKLAHAQVYAFTFYLVFSLIGFTSCKENYAEAVDPSPWNPVFLLWQTCIILTNIAADNGLFQHLILLFLFNIHFMLLWLQWYRCQDSGPRSPAH